MKTRSTQKRERQQEDHRKRNQRYKSEMRTAIKKVLSMTKKDESEDLYRQAVSVLDHLVSKGIIHKNTAARRKSKITQYYNSLP